MSKISFVRTVIPSEEFKEKETLGKMTFLHLDAEKEEKSNAYYCVECTYDSGVTTEEEARTEYATWKQTQYAMLLEQAKREKLHDIAVLDTSSAVNGFKLNGTVVWLDKATRVGLMNSTEITKNRGGKTTDLWLGEVKLTLDCDKVIELLGGIEMYALECYNTTARHKAEVQELKTVKEVEAYDIKEGYPEQLTIEV